MMMIGKEEEDARWDFTAQSKKDDIDNIVKIFSLRHVPDLFSCSCVENMLWDAICVTIERLLDWEILLVFHDFFESSICDPYCPNFKEFSGFSQQLVRF